MSKNNIKMSFIDKSVNVKHVNNRTFTSIKSGFKFSVFDNMFEQFGFKTVPSFVVGILKKHRYTKDYRYNMWTTSTTGVSKCNVKDVFDEVKGKRVSLSRAKLKAYIKASKTSHEIIDVLTEIVESLTHFRFDMRVYEKNEIIAIDNVIEYGVSNPEKK